MKKVIDFIDNEISNLRGADKELQLKLNLLKNISLFLSHNIVTERLDEIIQLIDMNTGYSEYRLINDCESDNKELWIEYTHENKYIRLSPGDFLLKMK